MSSPPRWGLTSIFPGIDSTEFRAASHRLRDGVAALIGIAEEAVRPDREVDVALVGSFEEIVANYEAMLELGWSLESYAAALADTDAGDTAAAAAVIDLEARLGDLRLVRRGLAVWLRSIDAEVLVQRSAVAAERAHALGRLGERAVHAMPADTEALAAELHPVAGGAWGRLRGKVVAGIRAEVEIDGVVTRVSLSTLRAMVADPDRGVRRRAYEAEVATLEEHAVPLGAALNGVLGEAVVLARRRGWESPLEEALFEHGIDQPILDLLQRAATRAKHHLGRFDAAKRRVLGVERLAWFDLAAPVGTARTWTFDEAAELVTTAFTRFSPALGGLAEDAFARRWVDAEPRSDKQGGGMCYWPANGVSPVRIEFHGGYDGVRMLAHELGHAYHFGLLVEQRRPLLEVEATPPPLMETAAKVCEEIVRREALTRVRAEGDVGAELALLDASLIGVRRSVVDAEANFQLERTLLRRRSQRELDVEELAAVARVSWQQGSGSDLDHDFPYPWSWAAQPHLFLDGIRFYNLPYLFGQLLAFGIVARHDAEPKGFPARLDAFLADVGQRPLTELGRSVGLDLSLITTFWFDAADLIDRDVHRYEELAGKTE